METILQRLQDNLEKALKNSFQELSEEFLQPEVVPSTHPQFGHYQCNNALKLAKVLKKSPKEVAQIIIEQIKYKKENNMLSKLEIAGPGFINLTLSAEFLAKEIEALLIDSHCGVPYPELKQRIVVEFSSPNIAKELHVGHLRSTIIGDALARLFEFLGHDVLRLNHIGDWGTQFGMLIAYLKEFCPEFLSGKKLADLGQLMHWYREAKKHFDEDPEFKKRSQLEVVNLQGGNEASLEVWEMICDISRRAFHEIYKLLDIKIFERGESFYNSYLPEIVSDLEKKGLITISHGAKCVFLEGFLTREGALLPVIVQKSDGGYNYDKIGRAHV